MKVLLIQAYHGRYEPDGIIFPIGLCYIATALKGHDVQIIDLNAYDDPYDELMSRILTFEPDIAGISLRNIDTTQKRDPFFYYQTLEPTVHIIKENQVSARIVIGGSGFSMFAREIMTRIPQIDFGVYLEGEESTPELLQNLSRPETVKGIFVRKADGVVFTGHRPLLDVISLPAPERHFLNVKSYDHPVYTNIGIQTKRGCPLMCAYCSYPFLNGRQIRARSARQVADEIECLKREYNIRRFMFIDSVFNVPSQHAEDICKEMINRRLDVEWSAYFNIRGFSEELLNLAIGAGCKNFSFSPDAVTDRSLKALGKGITEQDISTVIRMLVKTKGVRVEFHVFCTPPGQTFLGILKTLFFFFKVNALFLGRAVVHLGWIRIEPETGIFEIAKSEGLISEKTDLLPHNEQGLKSLFYSCPGTRHYGDFVFNVILTLQDMLLPRAKTFLRRNRGKKWIQK
ncbi:MAG: hypothetical protein QG552_2963 [Thermodesulfobacteriota bacterium]|nr:hypothetical protein [Thermodesulfobacteriota bacterium]